MRLEMFEVRSCCYFISLRTATKIFGFISLLGCFLTIFLSVWELIMVAKYERYVEVALVLDLLAQFIQIITSVFLLMGAYQERARWIPPWLVNVLVSAVLEVVFLPSLAGRLYGIEALSVVSTEWITFTVFSIVYDIYGMLVVFSYYRSLTPQS